MVSHSTATPDDFSKCRHIIYGFIRWGPGYLVGVHTLTYNKVNTLSWALASELKVKPRLLAVFLIELNSFIGCKGTKLV